MSDVDDLDFDDFGEEDGDDLDDFGDLELDDDDFGGEAIDFDDNFDEPADAGPLDEGELEGAEGGGDDAWRFDDTKLDDLEDFLKQVRLFRRPASPVHPADPCVRPVCRGRWSRRRAQKAPRLPSHPR